jgi:hypothetical protein
MKHRFRNAILLLVLSFSSALAVTPFAASRASLGGGCQPFDSSDDPLEVSAAAQPQTAQSPTVNVKRGSPFGLDLQTDRLVITHADRALAEFVFHDPKIRRPYFANVHGPRGIKITRNHPPLPGKDATDHDTMHPGIWLGFGDINGVDFWRNQGSIEHVRFVAPPSATRDQVTLATACRLQTPDGKTLGQLVNRCALARRPAGWLLIWDATFRATEGALTFGDQEEMGFGARVATEYTEKNGGLLRNSQGKKTAQVTWGQPAAWCDYSGGKQGQ